MFLIGCFLYYKDRGKYLFHFLFFWIAFCPSIYAFVVPMTDEAYWQILSWATKLAYLAMLDTLVINRSKYIIHQRKIAMLFCVALVYVLFLIAIRPVPFMLYLKYGLECFLIISGAALLTTRQPYVKSLYNLLRYGYFFEVLLGLLQIRIPLLNYKCSFENADLANIEHVIGGTFLGNNTYIEFLICLAILVIYIEYKSRNKLSIPTLFSMIGVVFLTFISGVRTPLIAITIPLAYTLLFYFKEKKVKKKSVIYLIAGCLVCFFAFDTTKKYISNSSVSYTQEAASATERQATLISILLDNTYLIQHTTFALSYSVLCDLPDNPIIGAGYFYTKGYEGYSYKDESSTTDATLVLFLGEFGLIGLVIIGGLFYVLLVQVNKKRRGAMILFYYLLVVTITDNGIFAFINLFCLITIIIFEDYIESTKQLKKS